MLPVGEGGGEEKEEAAVYTLRCEERVEEDSEGEGERW